MAKFRALMIWTDAWIADTHHLSRCERGTYMDLLILMWRTPYCRVPNDDDWLARHLTMSHSDVRNELRPLIKEFCQTDGNTIWQKRLVQEYDHSLSQSARAKSRWQKKKDACRNPIAADATVTVTVPSKKDPQKNPKRDSSSDARDEKSRGGKRAKPKVSLPEDWSPLLALEEGEEFERFKDHARANGRLCADWNAAWRNWKRSPYRKPNQGNGNGRRHGSALDACDRLADRIERGEVTLDFGQGQNDIGRISKR